MEVPLSRPDITDAERQAVAAVLHTHSLALGPEMPAFEQAFADYCGSRHAIAVSSGTAGLHACLLALGAGPDDEIITTPFSFIASTNCILFVGAKPVFVDIDPETWNIDPSRMEPAVTDRTRGLLPVDVFGQVADMDPILDLASRRGLFVLEDACEAVGGSYKGRKAGTFGHAGVFGFYPNKQVTTGEGGMIVTDDERLAQLCRSIRNQGRDPDAGWLAHARLGYNFRLPEMNCALGRVQIARAGEMLAKRARVAGWYRQRLRDEPRVVLARCHADVQMSWFVMVVRLVDSYDQADRDRILTQLAGRGIGCSNYFTPIHLQPFYRDKFGYKPGDFPVTEALSARTVALPFFSTMTEEQVDYVCRVLKELL
ncbi:MAG: DegT/DnrJ/EryC1/StrS family aminotransferase [Phycisphaerales bacterium]|nr:MAG: DegT/DnrJ/EryC1/StrS family aminotransferase [Phycisphaerales bacterium]